MMTEQQAIDTPHILVACTVAEARGTAFTDLEWEPCERGGLWGALNKDGEFVRFRSSFSTLQGYQAEGRKLYLGRSWIFAHSHGSSEEAIRNWEERGGEVITVWHKSLRQQLIEAGEV